MHRRKANTGAKGVVDISAGIPTGHGLFRRQQHRCRKTARGGVWINQFAGHTATYSYGQ